MGKCSADALKCEAIHFDRKNEEGQDGMKDYSFKGGSGTETPRNTRA